MATSRKHSFRVADSILREEWSAELTGQVVRLCAWLNQRWARDGLTGEQAGEAVIGAADAQLITGLRRPHLALQRLASLPLVARLSSASVALDDAQRPTRALLKWSKYAEFQGLTAPSLPRVCPEFSPSYSAPAPASSSLRSSCVGLSQSKVNRSVGIRPRAARAPGLTAGTLACWEQMIGAFARHGRAGKLKLTASRQRLIAGRVKEKHEPEDFGRAVDGYRRMHPPGRSSGDFDPERYFTPDTILRPSHFAKYVEAAAPQSVPWPTYTAEVAEALRNEPRYAI